MSLYTHLNDPRYSSSIRKSTCILKAFPIVLASAVFFATKSTEKCGQKGCWTYECFRSKCSSGSGAYCQDVNDIAAFCQWWPPAVDGRSRWRLQVLVFHFNWLCDKLRSVCTFAMLATGGGVMVASALNLASNDVRGETRQNPGCFTSALDEEAQTVYSHPFYWSQWLDDKTWS